MSRGVSIHIGVKEVDPVHYQGWRGRLRGCEFDARDLGAIADAQGFRAQLLLTAQATREAVREGIKSAARELEEGDILCLTYSGHGGQVPDYNLDEEDDNEDETWCLHDGQLLDDELFELWGDFQPGVRILVLSDSCHSGSVTKEYYDSLSAAGIGAARPPAGEPSPDYRVMPDDAAVRTYVRNRDFYDGIQRSLDPAAHSQVQASVLLISGCQDNQLSLDGPFNGLFTGTLLKVWRGGRYEKSYRDFHRDIVNRMPPTQTPNYSLIGVPNPAFESQRPFTI